MHENKKKTNKSEVSCPIHTQIAEGAIFWKVSKGYMIPLKMTLKNKHKMITSQHHKIFDGDRDVTFLEFAQYFSFK